MSPLAQVKLPLPVSWVFVAGAVFPLHGAAAVHGAGLSVGAEVAAVGGVTGRDGGLCVEAGGECGHHGQRKTGNVVACRNFVFRHGIP